MQMGFAESPSFFYTSLPSTPLPTNGKPAPGIRLSGIPVEMYTQFNAFNLKPAT
jgi:hypothetical protein